MQSVSTDGPHEDRHRVGSVASVFDHRKDHGWAPARVEDVMPRDTALHILSLYFDFVSTAAGAADRQVWPLIPCLHRPTFMADLAMGCDERDPMFFAVFMTVLAVTLVHVRGSSSLLTNRSQSRTFRSRLKTCENLQRVAMLLHRVSPSGRSANLVWILLSSSESQSRLYAD